MYYNTDGGKSNITIFKGKEVKLNDLILEKLAFGAKTTMPDCGRIIYWDDDMKDPLTLSMVEARRFLHTAPSALKDTSVSAFIPHCSGTICNGCATAQLSLSFEDSGLSFFSSNPPRPVRSGALFDRHPDHIQKSTNNYKKYKSSSELTEEI
jgi:hypothetical protein